MCTALTTGRDAWGEPVDEIHHHTLLRVSLVPTLGGVSGDILLIERVPSIGESYHSVTPIEETFSTGGTPYHPDVHDRISIISNGPSTALARDLSVERTLAPGDGSLQPHLTLAQRAQILDLVSQTMMLICAGGNCRFQSRSFASTCLAALTPRLPPPTLARQVGGGLGMNVKQEGEVDDLVFELGAEGFLGEVPCLVNDPASVQALRLIRALKDEPRERATARL